MVCDHSKGQRHFQHDKIFDFSTQPFVRKKYFLNLIKYSFPKISRTKTVTLAEDMKNTLCRREETNEIVLTFDKQMIEVRFWDSFDPTKHLLRRKYEL